VGLGLACACDFRLSTDRAVFRSAFLSVGLAGDMGLPWLLTRLVGPGPARRISLLDERIPATEALQLGLVDHVVGDDDLLPAATDLARRLAAGPPLATRALKGHLLAAERLDFDDFLDLEFQRHFVLAGTDDFREGWRALAERRPPRFIGR
jgi:2-(1,2-epoxy-1,2-dihydrophenyl)acetyl-CoA isomerase